MVKNRLYSFSFKIMLGLVILSIVIWKIGPSTIASQFRFLSLPYAILAFLMSFVGYILAGVSVCLLGSILGAEFKWREGMKGFLGTISLSIFLPGRLGDFSLPYYWRNFLRSGETLGVLVIDKILTLIWVLLFGSSGIYMLYSKLSASLMLIGGLSALCLLVLSFCSHKMRLVLLKFLPERFLGSFGTFIAAFGAIRERGKKALLFAFIVTGLRIVLYGFTFTILISGLGVKCPLFYPVCILAIAQFTSMLPISIMGIGTVEVTCIVAFARMGVDPTSVITANLVGRVITFLWLGIFFMFFVVSSKALPGRILTKSSQ